jgi:hypothetical protein
MSQHECIAFRMVDDGFGTIACRECGEEACVVVEGLRDDKETLMIMLRKCRKLAKDALNACAAEYAMEDMREIIDVVGDTLELVKGNRR